MIRTHRPGADRAFAVVPSGRRRGDLAGDNVRVAPDAGRGGTMPGRPQGAAAAPRAAVAGWWNVGWWNPSMTAAAVLLVILHLLVAALVVAAARGGGAPRSPEAYLARLESAIAQGDLLAAEEAWGQAYRAAMSTGRWRELAAVARSWHRLGARSGDEAAVAPGTRRLYLAALARAHGSRDIAGIVHVGRAFAELGDLPAARRCLLLAQQLGAFSDDPGRPDLLALQEALAAPRPDPRTPEAER